MNDARTSKLPLKVSLGLALLLLVAYGLWPGFREGVHEGIQVLAGGDRERISRWVEQFGLLGPLVISLAMVAQMFLIVIPSVALLVVAVLAYGGFWGVLISLAAIATASTVGYAAGAWLGPRTVHRFIGRDTEQKVTHYVEKYGVWAVIIARLSPVLSNDAISFVGGILRMGYWRFMAATLAGTLPLTLLIAWLEADTERLETGLWWLSGLSLAAFAAWLVYNRR